MEGQQQHAEAAEVVGGQRQYAAAAEVVGGQQHAAGTEKAAPGGVLALAPLQPQQEEEEAERWLSTLTTRGG